MTASAYFDSNFHEVQQKFLNGRYENGEKILPSYPRPGTKEDISITIRGKVYDTLYSTCLWSLRGWDLFRSPDGEYFFAGEYDLGGRVIPVSPREAGDWLRRRRGLWSNIGWPRGAYREDDPMIPPPPPPRKELNIVPG